MGGTPLSTDRVFRITKHLQPNDGEPIRSVVHQTEDAAIVAWTVKPGQRISPHVHPSGQDTWTVIAGEGDYQIDASGRTLRITAGDIAVAPAGAVHGVLNTGSQALVLVSVVSPALSGFDPL
jgi:quercetin dioxygenase-like cupin family protein